MSFFVTFAPASPIKGQAGGRARRFKQSEVLTRFPSGKTMKMLTLERVFLVLLQSESTQNSSNVTSLRLLWQRNLSDTTMDLVTRTPDYGTMELPALDVSIQKRKTEESTHTSRTLKK